MTTSQEDEFLWRHVTRNVRPLRGKPDKAAAGVSRRQSADRGKPPLYEDEAPVISGMPEAPAAGLERGVERRLKRGTFPIDYRLDLHGCTVAEARQKIAHALMVTAPASGFRLVHIITGKGARSGADEGWRLQGKLRLCARRWLQEPPLRCRVLAVRRAARHHGGDGALYVFLRKIPRQRL